MRPSNISLLGIAFCIYFIGGAVFDSLGSVLPFLCVMDMVIVGLFMGLLPKREGGVLFLVTALVDVTQVFINIPYREAELTSIFSMVALTSTPEMDFVAQSIPEWLIVPALIAYVMICAIVVYSIFKSLLRLLHQGKTIIILASTQILVFFILGAYIFIPFISDPNILTTNPLLMSNLTVKLLTLLDLYLVLVSPLFGYYFFRWLGIYRRLPHIYGNS